MTARPGGSGAVREAIEHILKGQGRWAEAVRTFDPEFAGDDARAGARP